LPAADKQFFEEISLKTNRFGCAFEGYAIFCGGHFQAGYFNNQSVYLFRSRSQVTSMNNLLADPAKVGRQARGELIFFGRDNGLDAAQRIISALNGLSSPAGLQHRSASQDGKSYSG